MSNKKEWDYIFTMFEHLDDVTDKDLVEACVYFIERYNFDIEVLPEHLYDRVFEVIMHHMEMDHYWDIAEESMNVNSI